MPIAEEPYRDFNDSELRWLAVLRNQPTAMIYLDCNLGLGDAIIMNGLVRYLAYAELGKALVVPCWKRNLPSVRHMFSDLENVVVLPVEGDGPPDREVYPNVIPCGIHSPKWGSVEPWDRAFYELAGVPFDAKWDHFFVPPSDSELAPPRAPFELIHEDYGRGFKIDGRRPSPLPSFMVEPKTPLLTDWRNFIREAQQIHVIDSAPMHLAELLPTAGKLYYHKYARAKGNRHHTDAVLRKDWTVLE